MRCVRRYSFRSCLLGLDFGDDDGSFDEDEDGFGEGLPELPEGEELIVVEFLSLTATPQTASKSKGGV